MHRSWESYTLRSGPAYEAFWKEYLEAGPRNVIYIGGRGFDPRAWQCLIPLGGLGTGSRSIWELVLGSGKRHKDDVDRNLKRVTDFASKYGWAHEPHDIGVKMRDAHGSSTAVVGPFIAQRADWQTATDIIIDLTAMPRALGLAFVHVFLTYRDLQGAKFGLHIVVSENPEIDRKIHAQGYEQSVYHMQGFEAAFESEPSKRLPTAWIPVLGENEAGQLEAVGRFLTDQANVERLPAVPSPARNPRRGDDLLSSYRNTLFELDGSIESQQIVYVAEANPFEACRQITRAMKGFQEVTQSHLTGARIALSLHSSKLLSLGAFMAAYEAKKERTVRAVTVLHMEPSQYDIDADCPSAGELVYACLRRSVLAP